VIVALAGFAGALLIPSIQRARAQASMTLCSDHLRQIGIELIRYAQLNGGALPVSATIDGPHAELLNSLKASGCLGDPVNYYCPAQQDANFKFSDNNFKTGVIGYYYYSAINSSTKPALSKFLRHDVSWPRILTTKMAPNSWVMSDIWISAVPTTHAGYRKGVNFLMLDGSVAFLGESPRQAFH